MFGFLKKSYELIAPITGQIIDLTEVKDELFSGKIMGDGVAVEPTGNTVVAPANGELTMIFPTNHAFGLKLRNGVEVLVHIGLDTVNLQGVGFERLGTPNRKVKAGEPIIRFDREIVKEHGCGLTTMVLITNMDRLKEYSREKKKYVEAGKDTVFHYQTK